MGLCADGCGGCRSGNREIRWTTLRRITGINERWDFLMTWFDIPASLKKTLVWERFLILYLTQGIPQPYLAFPAFIGNKYNCSSVIQQDGELICHRTWWEFWFGYITLMVWQCHPVVDGISTSNMSNVFHGTIALIAPIKVMGNLDYGMWEWYDLWTDGGDKYSHWLPAMVRCVLRDASRKSLTPNLESFWDQIMEVCARNKRFRK